MMLHTKYQDSRPCGFRQDFFLLNMSPCSSIQNNDHFWPQGNNLNKPGRVPLGYAAYQISRL